MKNLTDTELVDLAGRNVIGTLSGLQSQHAQAELTRRLMDSINSLNKETAKYSEALINLTLLLFAVGIIQLILAIVGPATDWSTRIIYIVFVFLFLYLAIRMLQKTGIKK